MKVTWVCVSLGIVLLAWQASAQHDQLQQTSIQHTQRWTGIDEQGRKYGERGESTISQVEAEKPENENEEEDTKRIRPPRPTKRRRRMRKRPRTTTEATDIENAENDEPHLRQPEGEELEVVSAEQVQLKRRPAKVVEEDSTDVPVRRPSGQDGPQQNFQSRRRPVKPPQEEQVPEVHVRRRPVRVEEPEEDIPRKRAQATQEVQEHPRRRPAKVIEEATAVQGAELERPADEERKEEQPRRRPGKRRRKPQQKKPEEEQTLQAEDERPTRQPTEQRTHSRRQEDERVHQRRPEEDRVYQRRPEEERTPHQRRPDEERITPRRPDEDRITQRRPDEERVYLRRPEEDRNLHQRRPDENREHLRRPDEERTPHLRRPDDERILQRRPEEAVFNTRRTEEDKTPQRRPDEERIRSRRPNEESVNQRRAEDEPVNQRRPVDERVVPRRTEDDHIAARQPTNDKPHHVLHEEESPRRPAEIPQRQTNDDTIVEVTEESQREVYISTNQPQRKRRKGMRKRPVRPTPETINQEDAPTVPTPELEESEVRISSTNQPQSDNFNLQEVLEKKRQEVWTIDEPLHTKELLSEASTPRNRLTPYTHRPTSTTVAETTRPPAPERTTTPPRQLKVTPTLSEKQQEERKALFSNTKRLPSTSAVIRRRLKPRIQSNVTSDKNESNKLFDPLNPNTISAGQALIPEGFTMPPEILSPRKLMEEIKQRISASSTTTSTTTSSTTTPPPEDESVEEPNYPKFMPKVTKASINDEIAQQIITVMGHDLEKIMTTSSPTTLDSTETSTHNMSLSEIHDHILDLLKSRNGTNRLSNILEQRNMTLDQLIEHRERGSSQLHLSDIFPKGNQGDTPRHKEEGNRDGREYEVNGDNNSKWRIVSPKYTPVSVRGVYEEIYLAKQPSTEIPISAGDFDNSIDDDDGEPGTVLLHRDGSLPRRNPSYPFIDFSKIPAGVKSAIIISGGILILAIFGFLSVLISCRVRQRRARRRATQDILCEQMAHEDGFIGGAPSQRSMSPVLTKGQHQQVPVFTQGIHSNTTSNRHYYLWRTLRKTFQYE